MSKTRSVDGAKCICGRDTVNVEVRKPGPNRGRWFWTCPTRSCSYFKWDTSASPYAQHPAEAYALAQPSRVLTNAFSQFRSSPFDSNPPVPAIEKTKISFTLATMTTIVIHVENRVTDTIKTVLDQIATPYGEQDSHRWAIPATHHAYQRAIRGLPSATPNLGLDIHRLSSPLSKTLEWLSPTDNAADVRETEMEERMMKVRYHQSFWKTLKPFQQAGIREAVRRNGRLMLADAAGLGKTMQAMGVMAAFDDDWPVLIVCPEEAQATWINHLTRWLQVDKKDIHIAQTKTDIVGRKRKRRRQIQKRGRYIGSTRITADDNDDTNNSSSSSSDEESTAATWEDEDNGSADLYSHHKIYITTFTVAAQCKQEIGERRFRFIVHDESQQLMKRNSPNNRKLVSIMQNTDRLLLLWNNPDLAHPSNLFYNLSALRKDMFPDFQKFGKTYCDGKQQVFGWNYSGISNQVELKFLLDRLLWIRRTEEDVKDELPF